MPFTPETARKTLLMHAYLGDDPRRATGFVGMLRPYQGLRQANAEEVVECIAALHAEFSGPRVDRELMSALWGICMISRSWGVSTDGMLQRNGLIDAEDTLLLERWIDAIALLTEKFLEGCPAEFVKEAVEEALRAIRGA